MNDATHKQSKPERIMSFRDQDAAESYCRRSNANWSVMPCRTAIENEFVYRWVA